MKALWKGQVLAQSDNTQLVEGTHYFPPESVQPEFFQASDKQTRCHWKGTASYFDVVVNGQRLENAAWLYPNTYPAAKSVEGYYAFWNQIEVVD